MNPNTHEISHGQRHVIVKIWLISSKTLFETSYLLLFSIDRPTYEFPHPLARVPQSAGYWVCYVLDCGQSTFFALAFFNVGFSTLLVMPAYLH